MSIVIITKRSFLICERIDCVSLQEHFQTGAYDSAESALSRLLGNHKKAKNSLKSVEGSNWQLEIKYVPKNAQSNKADSDIFLLSVKDKQDAFELFNEIIKQIREQCPDELYIDQLVSKMLNSSTTS